MASSRKSVAAVARRSVLADTARRSIYIDEEPEEEIHTEYDEVDAISKNIQRKLQERLESSDKGSAFPVQDPV